MTPKPASTRPHCLRCRDCGLACVLMVLKTLKVSLPSLAELHQLCGTTSVWTIDLAHLLSSFGIPVAFTTCTLGANPAYAREGFYMEQLPNDELRVQSLFQVCLLMVSL